MGGQLARRYGVPYRSSNVCAANAVDAQAAYESMFAIHGAIAGRTNLMMHGAGWMEGGLHASFEKMVIDADLLHMVSTFLTPLEQTARLSGMQFLAPYVLYGALRAPEEGLVEPHVDGYRQLLEAIRDDRYDFAAAEKMEVVTFDTLPMKTEA